MTDHLRYLFNQLYHLALFRAVTNLTMDGICRAELLSVLDRNSCHAICGKIDGQSECVGYTSHTGCILIMRLPGRVGLDCSVTRMQHGADEHRRVLWGVLRVKLDVTLLGNETYAHGFSVVIVCICLYQCHLFAAVRSLYTF